VKVTNEKTENRQAFLKIEMDPEEVETFTEGAYRRLVKKVNIPGFRRGKAPRAYFTRVYGEHELYHEMLEDLVPDAYKKAVEQEKLEPIAQAQVDVIQEEPIVIQAIVPLKPVVTLGDYKSIDMQPEKVEVTDEMVDQVVERLRHQYASWEPAEREVAYNDIVSLDIESTLQDAPFINRKGIQYQVVKDSVAPVPGFADQLVGMKKGDEKKITSKYPDDHADKELAGKEAVFDVKVIEIKQEIMPELNDAFAAQVDKQYTTVEALRNQILEDLKKHAEERSKQDFQDKVIEAATAASQTEYPPVLVEAEIDRLLEREFRVVERSGQTPEQYLKTIGKTVEEEREALRPAAVKRVSQFLVLGKVAEAENLTVSEEEINTEIEAMVAASNEDKEIVKKVLSMPRGRDSVEDTLITRKVVDRLVEIAGTSKTPEK